MVAIAGFNYYRHEIVQGTDYSITLELKSPDGSTFDTTGYSATAPIVNLDYESVDSFDAEFPTTGSVTLSLPKERSALLSAKRYLFQLKLIDPDGKESVYLQGDVIVQKGFDA